MTVLVVPVSTRKYIGLSTDTKPTITTPNNLPPPGIASTFWEYDTEQMFITHDSETWVRKLSPFSVLKEVVVTKPLAAASAYAANAVVSESASAGTAWTFANIARANGGTVYITGATIISESESVTPRFTLFLFNAIPTSNLNDDNANTAPDSADLSQYQTSIDFNAMESLGTTDSVAEPVIGQLPKPFFCASGADDLILIAVTRDAYTQTAGDDLTIKLRFEQY